MGIKFKLIELSVFKFKLYSNISYFSFLIKAPKLPSSKIALFPYESKHSIFKLKILPDSASGNVSEIFWHLTTLLGIIFKLNCWVLSIAITSQVIGVSMANIDEIRILYVP